jgi:glycosyltransferase involved in cell wall biosynthesis
LSKRILYISARADYGGGPQHILLLISKLKEKLDIFVACPSDPPYWDLYNSELGPDKMFEIPHRSFSLTALLGLADFIRINRIDIVHSHGRGAGVYSRSLKLLCRRLKIIHTFHGIHYEQKRVWSKYFYILSEMLLARYTDYFICVSRGERADALRLHLCKQQSTLMIHNGIDVAPDLPCSSLPPTTAGMFIVLHISRFDHFKNSGLIIEIADYMKRHDSRILFCLIGDGPEKNRLEELSRARGLENVLFLGFQPQASSYLQCANIYLSTSTKEGLPLSLLESLSAGIPIVASDIPGHDEIVFPGDNGFLFPINSPDIAANYLLRLKSDPALWERMSKNALGTYHNYFRTESMLEKLVALYCRAACRKGLTNRSIP